MIGDTNLFFANEADRLCAEAEIMIAEDWARGRKCGWEAMLHMLRFGISYLQVREFMVKIGCDNLNSINMFTKMGFQEICRSQVFNEVTLSKVVDDTWVKQIESELKPYKIICND